MASPYVDGTYPSGAPIVSMGTNVYKCNKISFNRGTETVNVTDPDGEHAGAIVFTGPVTGSAELQYANANVPDPNVCSVNATTGTFAANVAGANYTCFIQTVDIEKPQRGPWTATVTFQAKDN